VALIDLAVANLVKPIVVVGIPAFIEEKTIARVVLEALADGNMHFVSI
jgi:hypothetical protein